MSTPEAVFHRPHSVPRTTRLQVRAVVIAAHVLGRASPQRVAEVLRLLQRGAQPASYEQAAAARHAVVAVSLTCSGPKGCLARSLATMLLCRIRGIWPTWCVGVRRLPPFGAHAWVEAEGRVVGETYPEDYFAVLLTVP